MPIDLECLFSVNLVFDLEYLRSCLCISLYIKRDKIYQEDLHKHSFQRIKNAFDNV